MSLSLAELDDLYSTVSHEEAVTIANLGAQCYSTAKEQLYALWSATQDDDAEKEESWRKEGAAAMMESLKGRLAAGEAAQARVAVLQASVEAEVTRRVEEMVFVRMKEVELAKREEMLVLKQEIAELKGSMKHVTLLESSNTFMTEKISHLTDELTKLKDAATRSSHTIGKLGEATVIDLLEKHVAPKFPYAEVENVAKTKHVGDIHMSVLLPSGKRMKIMMDVKNYTHNNVNTKEIEKLYSDLDEHDSDVGLLVSLVSSITKKSPFQISTSPKGKPCLFVSFVDIDDGMRAEILCWAVRVLMGVMSVQDSSSKDIMITEIKQFIHDITVSLSEIEGHVRTAKSHYEGLRETKNKMLGRIQSYKAICGLEMDIRVKRESTVIPAEVGAIHCKGVTNKGKPCKFTKFLVDGYCKVHQPTTHTIDIGDDDGSLTIEHV